MVIHTGTAACLTTASQLPVSAKSPYHKRQPFLEEIVRKISWL